MKLLLTILLSLLVTISTPTIANGCFKVESDALLAFKAGLNDPGNLMSSWHGSDCCNWSGVTCDKLTKHVVKLNLRNPYKIFYQGLTGEIKLALLSLRYLTHLDLSGHNFLNLTVPKFIGSFENLVYLNLSYSMFQGVIPYELGNLSQLQFLDLRNSNFTGMIPPQLGNLSNLQYLNLAYSYIYSKTPAISSLSWLYCLSNLRYLDMSIVDLNNGVDWSSINKMHLLETLILTQCNLSKFPIDLDHVNLTSLTKLDLSSNTFRDTLPNWLWNLTGLLHLDLGYSKYHGSFPCGLSNLVSLNYLRLVGNYFDHVLLEPISKLQNLRTLDLRYLNIGGNILNLMRSLGRMWYNLEAVYLTGNNLSGNISSWIVQMEKLSIIDLSSNLLSGHISNQIGSLTQLKELYLYDNSLSGVITEKHFVNLTNLNTLDLSGNMLTVKINDKWVPPFQLQTLSLGSCKVGPPFPSWLRGQTQLTNVHLSNTSITGVIPIWLWNKPLKVLDLSDNKITGLHPFENHINDSIPYGICEMKYLSWLDLSNNAISGEIPFCWMNISSLMVMDLSNNKLTGQLPSSFGLLEFLIVLQLDNNKLHGEIPLTLQQCNILQLLSLGKNNFSGPIPSWIGKKLQNLVVLQLRSNKLSGYIPVELGELAHLQILDLSHNFLVGPIPSFVGNFPGMENNSSGYLILVFGFDLTGGFYKPTLYIDINGQEVLTSLPLVFAKTIDISDNYLAGHIPEEILLLDGVINLNLSNNCLRGEIPETIGAMRSLESLDFSCNNLSGPIPEELSSLSLLHNLNLSYNNFSGKIPIGRQLDTLSNPSIYDGNPYLCGPPINKNCFEEQRNGGTDFVQGGNAREMIWFYFALALGFILAFWTVWVVLIFENAWKVAYFRLVDSFFDEVYVHTMLGMKRLIGLH